MNNLKKVIIMFTLVLVVAVVGGSTIQLQAATIKLNKKSLTLEVGGSYALKLKNSKSKVKWSTANSKVAKVNKKGRVLAQGAGSTKIYAKVGDKKYACKVKVNFNEIILVEGNIETIEVKGVNVNKVNWKSSNESVAEVSDGTIISKGAGTATITAKVEGITYTCGVTVNAKPEKQEPVIEPGLWMSHFKVDYIKDTADGVLVKATNTSNTTINSVFGYVSYTDEMGDEIQCKYQDQTEGIAPNESFYLTFSHPYGDYQSLICNFTINDIFTSSVSMKSALLMDKQWVNVNGDTYKSGVTVKNNSTTDLDFELIAIYKYKGNIVGFLKNSFIDIAGASVKNFSFEGSTAFLYDDVEIVINDCFVYLMDNTQ